MPGDEIQQIMDELTEATNIMAAWLGGDPKKHAMLRGTFEAALAEAQGAELIKPSNFTPANQSFKHYDSMRDGANALQNAITQFRAGLTRLSTIDPKAAQRADISFRPLVDSAAYRVNLAQQTEKMIVEIANTGNSTRLQGVPLNQSRDSAGLVSNQLRQMNLNLAPQGLSQGTTLLDRIRQLPTTFAQAREEIKRIALMVSTTAGAFARAGTSAASRAMTALSELMVAFGSRFTVFIPPIPTDQLQSMPGATGKGA